MKKKMNKNLTVGLWLTGIMLNQRQHDSGLPESGRFFLDTL